MFFGPWLCSCSSGVYTRRSDMFRKVDRSFLIAQGMNVFPDGLLTALYFLLSLIWKMLLMEACVPEAWLPPLLASKMGLFTLNICATVFWLCLHLHQTILLTPWFHDLSPWAPWYFRSQHSEVLPFDLPLAPFLKRSLIFYCLEFFLAAT